MNRFKAGPGTLYEYPGDISPEESKAISSIPYWFRKSYEGLLSPAKLSSYWELVRLESDEELVRRLNICKDALRTMKDFKYSTQENPLPPPPPTSEYFWTVENSWTRTRQLYCNVIRHECGDIMKLDYSILKNRLEIAKIASKLPAHDKNRPIHSWIIDNDWATTAEVYQLALACF